MTRFFYSSVLLLLLASAFESKPSHGIGLQAFDNSTNAIGVARRQIAACTPDGNSRYYCQLRGYTQVPIPDNGWIPTTTIINLYYNRISFIPADAFNGLKLMTGLYLNNNKITLIPVGMVDTNIALEEFYLGDNDIDSFPTGLMDNNLALKFLGLNGNAITLIPVGMVDNNPALILLHLADNAINSIPAGMLNNNPALKYLVLGGNPLVCSNFSPENTDEDDYYSGSWVQGTALSTICTSCTDGTPETITIDTVDFWQCSTCILKNDAPSSTEVNDAMEVFCPDYAIDVGVKGKPEYGGSAKMCKEKDQKYETRLHKAMFHGMFGGASSSGRDCGAWCLFDVEEQNRHFRWDNRNTCWKTKKNRPCTGSTNVERVFAADISDSFC